MKSAGGQPAHVPTISWAGDRFLRVDFGAAVNDVTLAHVHESHRRLRAAKLDGVQDVTPAYTTLLVTLDLAACSDEIVDRVRSSVTRGEGVEAPGAARVTDVPVCFGGEHGPDLEELASACGLTSGDAVAAYCAADYRVAFIGFTPGFAYIRGLPERLAMPRLASPRARVAAGSVGIAGTQTGVYPGGTPGGWRLIGRTPLRVFDAANEPAALLAAGDCVRFVPIDTAEFGRLNQHEGERW